MTDWARVLPESGRRSFDISTELLAKLLALPDGCEIIEIRECPNDRQAFRLVVTDPRWERGEYVQHLTPYVSLERGQRVWHWGDPADEQPS